MRRLAFFVGVALFSLVPLTGFAGGHGGGGGGGGHGGGHGGGGQGWGGHSGGGSHHGWHGGGHHGFGARVFVGGFWDPFYFPGYYPYYYPYYAPYYAPYPYPSYGYAPPPDDDWDAPPPPAPDAQARSEAPPPRAVESPPASYGLVQLRGIPDGADIDLDGRFWMTARDLDERWVAMPNGTHTLSVSMDGGEPVVRRIEVRQGKTQVVRFGPFPRSRG